MAGETASTTTTASSVDPSIDEAPPAENAPSARLKVVHRTQYHYGAPANRSSNEVKLQPRETPWQSLTHFLLTVRPATRLRHFRDLNNTVVHYFEITENHTELIIESNSTVEVRRKIDFDAFPYGSHHDTLEQSAIAERWHEYLQPSHFVGNDTGIWRDAVDARDESTDVFQTAYNIMRWIYENYEYRPGATHVSTTAEQAREARSGVCQDFAHVAIAMCRSLGIPARYVSGYLFDPNHDSLRGTQASHAWFEVFLPDKGGWYGFDPTNNKVIDEHFVTLAKGRDYADVTPASGSFFGGGSYRKLEVSVEVSEV